MARVIVHTEAGPRKIDADDIDSEKGDVAICQCGLSEGYPFCDGSHRATRDERKDALFRYGKGGTQRREVAVVETSDGSDESQGTGV